VVRRQKRYGFIQPDDGAFPFEGSRLVSGGTEAIDYHIDYSRLTGQDGPMLD
jgi:hypothetical protein